MEKRGVIYTFWARSSLTANQHFNQILYSIETIRKFEHDLPVKVFLSPEREINYAQMRPDRMFPNVEIVGFDNQIDALYPSYIDEGYAHMLDHRWINVMKAFELWDFDRVLFLDGDTFFNRSPHELFNKYTNPECLWAREDVCSHITQSLGLGNGINDGQFLLSRRVFEKVKHEFRVRHKCNIYHLLKSSEGVLSAYDHHHLHWLSSQYAALQTFEQLGVYVGHFDPKDVTLSTEPVEMHGKGDCSLQSIIHHYFFGNTPRYLPARYWSDDRRREFLDAIKGRELCTKCGHLS